MYATRQTISLTTAADGSATGYSVPITGRISDIIYTKNDFADGVDFVITLENTGQAVLSKENVNASVSFAPRQGVHSVLGVAAVYAAAGEPVLDYIIAADDRVKVVVAAGGNAKTGTITVIVA